MIAPTDRRDDRMYVYTVRSSRRSVAWPIAATIASCKHAITGYPILTQLGWQQRFYSHWSHITWKSFKNFGWQMLEKVFWILKK